MPGVFPFKALRPQKQFVEAVAAHPYDVVSVKEAKDIVRENPLSFLRIEKSDVDMQEPHSAHDDRIYEIAKENLDHLVREKIMLQDQSACLYIYRQQKGDHEQYGIVGRVDLAEYEEGRIKKHELTKVDKEVDRVKHVLMVNANTGPVFLTYLAHEFIDSLVKRMVQRDPEYDFTADDGVSHTVWVLNDEEDISALTNAFKKVDAFYIADGHHRAAAAATVRRVKRAKNPAAKGDESYNFVLAVLFPHNQLQIMSYNRLVKDLNGLSDDDFLYRIGICFDIEDNLVEKLPGQCHEIGMYFRGRWYRLTAREGSYDGKDPVKVLDVSILHDNLLNPVLGITEPRTDRRVEYVSGVKGLQELERIVDSGEYAVAFSLYSTRMEQLMAASDAGKAMPPKSTWFEPKLRSGIFVHLLT